MRITRTRECLVPLRAWNFEGEREREHAEPSAVRDPVPVRARVGAPVEPDRVSDSREPAEAVARGSDARRGAAAAATPRKRALVSESRHRETRRQGVRSRGGARGDPGHGAITANGHVRYTKSWTGPTDIKKVGDQLDAVLKAFVSSRKGTKYSEVRAQGAGAEFGWLLHWEFKVDGRSGWFNPWIVPGADNRFTLVIVCGPSKRVGGSDCRTRHRAEPGRVVRFPWLPARVCRTGVAAGQVSRVEDQAVCGSSPLVLFC
jgi:hypothetical protein